MQVISKDDRATLTAEERKVWMMIQEFALEARRLAGLQLHYTVEFAAFDVALQAEHVLRKEGP